jgi:hypothetical protein
MKVLILWTYYQDYLSYFYSKNPFVSNLPFEEHRSALLNDHFGWPADLSCYMNRRNINTEFIIPNDRVLQMKWAKEHSFHNYTSDKWEKEIALAQIRWFKPDVLWIGAMFDYYGDFLRQALDYCKSAITWISCPIPDNLDVTGFSVLVTSHSDLLKDKQHLFEKVVVARPGFNAEILDALGYVEKKYDVVLVGNVSPYHTKRAEVLAYLLENGIDIKVFGRLSMQPSLWKLRVVKQAVSRTVKHHDFRGAAKVLGKSFRQDNYDVWTKILESAHYQPVFGMDMYKLIAASRIGLNVHIDIAGDRSGNMRMFEVTGVGSCLITEHSSNIEELFEPDQEVLTYRSKEELLEIIQGILDKKQELKKIAKAGQQRTLRSHNMERLFNDIKPALEI